MAHQLGTYESVTGKCGAACGGKNGVEHQVLIRRGKRSTVGNLAGLLINSPYL